jgi:hypothetical protein
LPDFSQPYRLLSNDTIGSHFNERKQCQGFSPWDFLLKRYWTRFSDWLPLLCNILAEDFNFDCSNQLPTRAWERIGIHFGDVAGATAELTGKSGVTLFGIYRCHHPFHRLPERSLIHTSVLFRSGKDPPPYKSHL